MKQRILRTISGIFGAAVFINGAALLFIYRDAGVYLTLFVGLVFLLPAIFLKTTKICLSFFAGKFLFAILLFLTAVTLLNSWFLFIYGNSNNSDYKENYLIVLGCGLIGDKPSASLQSRLDCAVDYLNKNTECKVIVSGGQGPNELCSEAAAMEKYLIEKNVEPNRIIKEDKSSSTIENIRFSNQITNEALSTSSVVFITNDYHVYRAHTLASVQGFDFHHIGAKTEWYNLFPAYLREQLAIVKALIFGNMF